MSNQCRSNCGSKTYQLPPTYADMDIQLIFLAMADDEALSEEVRDAAALLSEKAQGTVEPHLENYQWRYTSSGCRL